MPIRMTGLVSGLDTESLVKSLVEAQKLKNKKWSDKLTLSEWKEEKWKDLNAKLYKLATTELDKVRFQSNYSTKKVTSSNESLITATGSTTAPEGAHEIKVESLASSQYVTSGTLKDATLSTTIKDLSGILNTTITDGSVIQITNGSKKVSLAVTDTTTISDFVTACKNAGLNANFDSKLGRIFVSSKSSGTDNKFSITTGIISNSGSETLEKINELIGSSNLSASQKSTASLALGTLEGISGDELTSLYNNYVAIDKADTSNLNSEQKAKVDAIKTLVNLTKSNTTTEATKKVVSDIKANLRTEALVELGGDSDTAKETAVYNSLLKKYAALSESKDETNPDVIAKATEEKNQIISDGKINEKFEALVNDKIEAIYAAKTTVDDGNGNNIPKDEYIADYVAKEVSEATKNILTSISSYANSIGAIDSNNGQTSVLTSLGLDEITGDVDIEDTTGNKMTVVKATDATIKLDGALITSSSNTVTANGLTINLNSKSAVGETITLNVANNNQAVYDTIKNFVKTYNSILSEMNTLYYAESARGYDPLSDDEREAMTDDQIEKWEKKIKDSLLRRDNTLSSLLTSMKSAMASSVTVNGKPYSLSSFGITTSTNYSEKGLLHIYGDSEDSTYASSKDKLMAALNEDPETVMQVLTGITGKLYETMQSKMKSIPNVRSSQKFYNDKSLDKEQVDYKKKISELESKLTDLENKYYKQFAAMETTLSKLQSQTNSLMGLLGN